VRHSFEDVTLLGGSWIRNGWGRVREREGEREIERKKEREREREMIKGERRSNHHNKRNTIVQAEGIYREGEKMFCSKERKKERKSFKDFDQMFLFHG
jgi:hypothetical protein